MALYSPDTFNSSGTFFNVNNTRCVLNKLSLKPFASNQLADNDGQMIFGVLGGLKLPDICLTGEEKPRKNLTQETCPGRGSNPQRWARSFVFQSCFKNSIKPNNYSVPKLIAATSQTSPRRTDFLIAADIFRKYHTLASPQ